MENAKVIKLAKELMLCDERELLAKVVISYRITTKIINATFNRHRGAGLDGFIGIYHDDFVCFYANMFGTKPHKEHFRIPLSTISKHDTRKGFLGLKNQWIVDDGDKHHQKFYFSNRRKDTILQMDSLIKSS